MVRFKVILPVVIAVSIFSTFGADSARADSRSPIYCAADAYREAVREFERLVLRIRYIERVDERLVDDLEDSTARLRSAARDYRRLDRLSQRFAETDRLHCRVESVFFTRPVYPPNRELDLCWRDVSRAYVVLVNELRQLQIVRGSLYSSQLGRLNNERFVPTGGKSILTPPLAAPPVAVPVPPVIDPAFGQFPSKGFSGGRRPSVVAPSFGSPSAGTLGREYIAPEYSVPGYTPSGYVDRPFTEIPGRADGRANLPDYSRRSITISTKDQLRQAIIGALLQRR